MVDITFEDNDSHTSEIDAQGNVLFDCPLAGARVTSSRAMAGSCEAGLSTRTATARRGSGGWAAALKAGYWTNVETLSDGGSVIAGYALPGLDEASSRWTTWGGWARAGATLFGRA